MKHLPTRRRIVVGVDGSAASVAGLRWAAREAGLRRAELLAVCAWEGAERCRAPYAPLGGLPSPEEDRVAAASLLAASVHAALGQALPAALRTELAEGRAERVLLDRAAGAELLVLGSTSRPGPLQNVAGPVHRACLRGAPCPVVIVGGCVNRAVTDARAGDRHPRVAAGAAARC
ncbi:MAG: universal stress protein [Streptosporangiaceae bacterium]